MKFSLLAATALCAPLSATSQSTWSLCSKTDSSIKVTNVVFALNPIQYGKDIAVAVSGTALTPIQPGAMANVNVKAFGFTVWSKAIPICDENTACPLHGQFTMSKTIPNPNLPFGGITLPGTMVLVNADGSEMACVALNFGIPSPS